VKTADIIEETAVRTMHFDDHLRRRHSRGERECDVTDFTGNLERVPRDRVVERRWVGVSVPAGTTSINVSRYNAIWLEDRKESCYAGRMFNAEGCPMATSSRREQNSDGILATWCRQCPLSTAHAAGACQRINVLVLAFRDYLEQLVHKNSFWWAQWPVLVTS
jgi:hypothetical protein